MNFKNYDPTLNTLNLNQTNFLLSSIALINLDISNFEYRIFVVIFYDIILFFFFRLIRPVGNSTDRLTVKMGLKLSQIIGVDMKRQILITNVWLEQVRRIYLMSGSSHIWSVLIGVEYRNCCWIWGCLFTFCYLDGANSIKTDLHTLITLLRDFGSTADSVYRTGLMIECICNLWTGQFAS